MKEYVKKHGCIKASFAHFTLVTEDARFRFVSENSRSFDGLRPDAVVYDSGFENKYLK